MMHINVFEQKAGELSGAWSVTATEDDGTTYQALFVGPHAEYRAKQYSYQHRDAMYPPHASQRELAPNATKAAPIPLRTGAAVHGGWTMWKFIARHPLESVFAFAMVNYSIGLFVGYMLAH